MGLKLLHLSYKFSVCTQKALVSSGPFLRHFTIFSALRKSPYILIVKYSNFTNFYCSAGNDLIGLARTPPTIVLSGTSLVTTAPAATITLLPI